MFLTLPPLFSSSNLSFLFQLPKLFRINSSKLAKMATQENDTDKRASSSSWAPATEVSSCRRKKNFGSGSFVSDLRDHFHEFLSASANEHRTCFKNTIQKMFKSSKVVGENSGGGIEGEVSLPLQTTIAD